jgi:hypothetical protein
MISGIFHSGSGLGNQLHRYVATRVLALDKGHKFSIIAPENFKGKAFLNLDMGFQPSLPYVTETPEGKVIPLHIDRHYYLDEWKEKTNYYNPEINFIEDNTVIDGEFQDERYFEHRFKEINEWLKVGSLDMFSDICVINFRGGEFYAFPELGLPKEYFDTGIKMMKEINPDMKFEVHTDDPILAKEFFPEYKVIHDTGINWRSLRFAKYAIISNSSFAILPRLLKEYEGSALTIAPRYWARRNTGVWSMPQNYYKDFQYI